MLMNTDHHHHRRNRPNDAAETFHLHITNKPDSQPDSSDNMSSTQTSPVATSQWSYREQPCLAVDVSSGDGVGEWAWTVYSGSLDRSVKIWRVCAQTVQVERREPAAPSKQKDRQRRGCNAGFQRFTDQGRLNPRRK
ncbi:hypothetical protein L1987_18050 [Smallanthus sonchifolius]|uniref:Uncharacterized protein n=1 Tax=Smallanthus sonchifolius TaxID=185202 RepID=A0ACB9IZ89_9ASTR|nr:hypothetical protein L1987_18050 [Smallanthus sonchifolius]